MIQLRGLGETDCDPTKDPVCAEFYGYPTPVATVQRGKLDLVRRVAASLPKFPTRTGSGAAAGDGTPLEPSVPAALLPAASCWSQQSLIVKAVLVGGGAFVAYKGYQRYVAK